MRIIYAVTGCSEKVYTQLFSHVKLKPAAPAQKYHRLLIEGLAHHLQVDVIANPPVNRSILDRSWTTLSDEQVGNAYYYHLPAIKNPILKLVCVALGTFIKTLRLAEKDSAVIIDCLNRTAALAAQLAARIRKCRCIGIVTDLPSMLQGSGMSKKLANYIISNCTDYIFLTEAMNDRLNSHRRPYVILEGHADISMQNCYRSLEQKRKPRVCMYAGAISKLYGLDNLIRGFEKANLINTELHLFGYCDFEAELLEITKKNPRIHYGGLLLNSEIVEKEQSATLLVNPRPTYEEYVKYSFPSKTMEYMASGTPVLTTVLPGMPKAYYPYVYLLKDETADGIAEALKEVLSQSDEALFEKGRAAKEFILTTRNNVVQAGKILDMLEKK